MNRKFLKIMLLAILLVSPVLLNELQAQIPDPNNGGNGPPVGAPLDGGAALLLAAGAIAGGKKLYEKRKKND
jgi:hypothetical protein